MEISEELANRFRLQRLEKGLRQDQLAQRVGLTERTIRNIEGGRLSASPETLRNVAKYLDIPLNEVFSLPKRTSAPQPMPLCLSPRTRNGWLITLIGQGSEELSELVRTVLVSADPEVQSLALDALVVLLARDGASSLTAVGTAATALAEQASHLRRFALRVHLSVRLAQILAIRGQLERTSELLALWMGLDGSDLFGGSPSSGLLNAIGTAASSILTEEFERWGIAPPVPFPGPLRRDLEAVLDLLRPTHDWSIPVTPKQFHALARLTHPRRDLAWQLGQAAIALVVLHRPADVETRLLPLLASGPHRWAPIPMSSGFELAAIASEAWARRFAPTTERFVKTLLREHPGELLPVERREGGFHEPLVSLGNVLCRAAPDGPVEVLAEELPRVRDVPLSRLFRSLGYLGLLHPRPTLATIEAIWEALQERDLEAAEAVSEALNLIRVFHPEQSAQAEEHLVQVAPFPAGSDDTADYWGACRFVEAWGAGVLFATGVLGETPLGPALRELFFKFAHAALKASSLVDLWTAVGPGVVRLLAMASGLDCDWSEDASPPSVH